MTVRKRAILILIDGLTPSMLEATDAPTLRYLLDSGTYRRALSTFLRYSHEQGLAKQVLEPQDLFAPESLESFKI